MKSQRLFLAFILAAAPLGCGSAPRMHSGAAAPTAPPAQSRGTTQANRASTPIDPRVIETTLGARPDVSPEHTAKVSFPRNDIPVEIDGWGKVPPFMGLTSWAAFAPGTPGVAEAMVMGDLVLFEDEVNPVMSAALDHGLAVTALHNHFFFDHPHVFFMHVEGEGDLGTLAKSVRTALDAQKAVRQQSPTPVAWDKSPPPSPSHITADALDSAFGVHGDTKDGMYKATMGRRVNAACGCSVGKSMGVNTWAAFAGSDNDAIVDGDFAVAESELQPVLKSLRGGGINIVAIHQHMTGESPRILFLHYWGRGPAAGLAAAVKRAVDLTAWDRGSPANQEHRHAMR